MKILGIDPGVVRTGYGLIEVSEGPIKLIEAGVIKTSTEDGITKRLLDIHENLEDIIAKHTPEVLVLEKLYSHYKHPTTALLMGHARGIVCLSCGINKIKLVSYPSTRIKKTITGNGRAGKHQIQRMVKSLLGLHCTPEYYDITDALAMAISYVYIERVGKKN